MTATDIYRFQVETPYLDQRRFEFPNGHEVSVTLDGSRLFRFEVWSTDPADAARGEVVPDLTSEQVEAKVAAIRELPQREV